MATTNSLIGTYGADLKEYYTDDMVRNVTFKNNPLMAMIPKMEGFEGKVLPLPIVYADPQGIADSISQARLAKTESKISDFVLFRARKFGLISIDNEVMLASKSKKGAFLEVATLKTDGIMRQFANDVSTELFGDGNGILSDDLGTLATLVFTLANKGDIVFFEEGMSIVAFAGDTTDNSTVAKTAPKITGINRNAGTITLDKIAYTAGASTSRTFASNGDAFRANINADNVIKGLRAWLPASVTSTAFFGLDRTADSRLAGNYVDGSALSLINALETIVTRVIVEGGKPDALFINPAQYNSLKVYFQSKVNYQITEVKVGEKVTVDFRGIVLDSSEGPVPVYSDRRCPVGDGFCLQLDTWKLYSLKGVPHLQKYDGLSMLRENDADGVEMRIASYAQLGCAAPSFNGRVKLPAPTANIYI